MTKVASANNIVLEAFPKNTSSLKLPIFTQYCEFFSEAIQSSMK